MAASRSSDLAESLGIGHQLDLDYLAIRIVNPEHHARYPAGGPTPRPEHHR